MPTVKDDKRALDIAISNPQSNAAPIILEKLGLNQDDLRAGIIAKQLESQDPKDPRIPQIRNKIFQKVAQARPSQDPGFFGGGSVARVVSKNLIDQNPKVQAEYFKRLGNETRFVDGNLEIRKPDETQFTPVDPEGIDAFDAFDIIGDVFEGVIGGIGGVVGGVAGATVGATAGTSAGPLGTIGGGILGVGVGAPLGAGLATAAYEEGRQSVAKSIGARDEKDISAITQAGLLGAGGEVLAGGAGLALRTVGKGISKVVSKFSAGLKKSSPEIEAAAKELGAKATPGMLSDSRMLQDLESAQAQSGGMLGGYTTRKQIESNKRSLQDVADALVSDASHKSQFDVGDLAGRQLSEGLRTKLEPAEAIYNKYEVIFKRNAYKPNTTPIINKITQLKEQLKFDKPGLSKLESFEDQISNIENLTDLKKFRTAIGNELGRDPLNKSNNKILSQLYGPITDSRSQTLMDLSKSRGGEFFDVAKSEIEQADQIYKQSIEEVTSVIKRPGSKIKGSPKKELEQFLVKTPEEARINKVLASKDPAKIAAVQKAFPEAFETLRAGKIEEIAKASTKGAEIVPRTLAKKINALPPETIHLIFGPHAEKKAKAITLFLEATPKMVGGSGTTQARRFFGESAGIKFPGYAYVMRQLASVSRDFSLNVRAKAMGVEDNILTKIGKWFKESPIPTAATIVSGRQGLFDKPMDQSPRFGTKVQQQTPILGR